MKWCWHISRMDKERWPSIVHNWKPTEKTTCWTRPKQRWMDNIEMDLKRASLSLYGITTERNRVRLEELVGDRERWKDITAASMAGRAYRITTWPDSTHTGVLWSHLKVISIRKDGLCAAMSTRSSLFSAFCNHSFLPFYLFHHYLSLYYFRSPIQVFTLNLEAHTFSEQVVWTLSENVR